MTSRLLTRQAQEKLNCVETDTTKGFLKQAQGANVTRYDFREGFSRRLLFPVKKGSIQELLSQAIVLGYFPDTLDNLGREGRLVGEAPGSSPGQALELWLKERKKREDHAQAKEDAARL